MNFNPADVIKRYLELRHSETRGGNFNPADVIKRYLELRHSETRGGNVNFNPADVIKRYLELREEKRALVERQKAELLALDNTLDAMESFFLLTMQERKEVQIKTEHGTAFQSPQLRVKMADRVALVDYVKRTGDFDFFTNSVAKDAVTAYVEAHQAPPPGVEITRFIACNVRKA